MGRRHLPQADTREQIRVSKKLIEVALPLDVINRETARENYIYRGNPSAIHKWWGQKPLGASRAVLFAQLVDDPSSQPRRFPTEASQTAERRRLFAIIERLAVWESSQDRAVLAEAEREIRRCYPNGIPTVVDPFCGAGTIPLEALRMGLQARGSDLNPVAVLITKSITQLPHAFADLPPIRGQEGELSGTAQWVGSQGLGADIRWYGRWIRGEASRRLAKAYPTAELNGEPVTCLAWIWARTVTCPNPACRATMPLAQNFWLSRRKKSACWARPVPTTSKDGVRFEVATASEGSAPNGTVGRSGARCLLCSSPVNLEYIRAEARAGRMGSQMVAMVVDGPHGRTYLAPTDEQIVAAAAAQPPDSAPQTELPEQALGFRVQAYGMTHHASLFTNRQLLAMCTFSDLVIEARTKVLEDGGSPTYADAIATYLAFALDKHADYGCSLAPWYPQEDRPSRLFGRQTISMAWNYAELNPLCDIGGSFVRSADIVAGALEGVPRQRHEGLVSQASADAIELSDEVVSTDPPYYDNVAYADLSDFFYVWLRRSLKEIYPDLFATVLTPKREELVAEPARFGGKDEAERHFEDGFTRVFARLAATHPTDTPMTVYYAFRQQEGEAASITSTGWETLLQGILTAGLSVTGTWPIRSERTARLRDISSNAMASSIVLVCRPRPSGAAVTDRRGFIRALKARLVVSLRDLQSGGIAPVDLAQAAIGPGMAVFSSYARVLEPSGATMSVHQALALINQALDEVSAEQEGEFDEYSRWAVSWFTEYGHDNGPYGRADDLARAKNVSVDGLVRAGIVQSRAGSVRLLDREELDPGWDPLTDNRVTVWEVCQHLIRRLDDGLELAGDLLARVGGLGDAARDLSYRLFQIAEAKKWPKEAAPYNALAAEWPELTRIASAGPAGQGTLL
jgi:putative DNA methylase